MYRNILLPVSMDHTKDLATVIELAKRMGEDGAKITVLTVLEPVPVYVSASLPEHYLHDVANRANTDLRNAIGDDASVTIKIETGHAAAQILEHAKTDGVDCIILNARIQGIPEFLLGSITQRIARRAHCSVHIYR